MTNSNASPAVTVKIMAEPVVGSPNVCKFIIDAQLVEKGSFRFASPEEARGSILAESLFALGSLSEVLITPKEIWITKRGYGTWRELGASIGAAIRQALASGQTLLHPDAWKKIPPENELRSKIEALIETEINPMVAGHGGYIELVAIEANDIFVRMGGGCQGCSASKATLKQGVETTFRKHIPELGRVVDATDHESGANPYFS